jgi:arsenate reductase
MTVLFICKANASRSQIAEGWFNYLTEDSMAAFSAGYSPCGKISSRAVAVMREAGIDISSHYSKGIDYFGDMEFDYVVPLCAGAAEHLSQLAGEPVVIDKQLDDPFEVIGSEETMLDAYRVCRDKIKAIAEDVIARIRRDNDQDR